MRDDDFGFGDELDDDDDIIDDMFIIFALEDRDYGIHVKHVTEIVTLKDFTEIPDMPAFVRGIVNIRGRILPLLDMRVRFGLTPMEYGERTSAIIVEPSRDTSIGLIVDAVKEVTRISADKISPAPRVGEHFASRFIESVGRVRDEMKVILNIERLLNERESTILQEFQTEPGSSSAGGLVES